MGVRSVLAVCVQCTVTTCAWAGGANALSHTKPARRNSNAPKSDAGTFTGDVDATSAANADRRATDTHAGDSTPAFRLLEWYYRSRRSDYVSSRTGPY